MELQFEKSTLDCLNPVASQVRAEEQTQELRLADAMPDIGRVLGAWGQVLLRGKEWRSGGMSVSGGIMAWVLYDAEDGSGNQTVETWIPFQLKWDFPETKHDGVMVVSFQLSSVDARSVSARKLMVRATVSAMGEALEPVQAELYTPGDIPADVQMLTRSYPVRLPREAGEKSFALDEELTLPSSAGSVEKLVQYGLQCQILDQKVMADKVVFRGNALVHMLYRAEDDTLKTWDAELPFSQFADLDREYGADGEVRLVSAVTGLELDILGPDRLHLKAGLTGQYVIYDRPVITVAEDAYSVTRALTPKLSELTLPVVLDDRQEKTCLEHNEEVDAERIVDTAFLAEQPRQRREEGQVQLELPGNFQILYYDHDGRLQGKTCHCQGQLSVRADENCRIMAQLHPTGNPQTTLGGGSVSLRCDAVTEALTTADGGMRMLTGMELGEETRPDASRPSLILRRCGKRKLWDLAKSMNSTVEAIMQANQLQGEPEEDRMLLIPVS